jgi:hypothetical protein
LITNTNFYKKIILFLKRSQGKDFSELFDKKNSPECVKNKNDGGFVPDFRIILAACYFKIGGLLWLFIYKNNVLPAASCCGCITFFSNRLEVLINHTYLPAGRYALNALYG